MKAPNILLGQEKLSFYNPYSPSDVLKILERTKSKHHLEFHGITFNKNTLPIWQKYGASIQVVGFFDCTFDDVNFAAFVKCCDKLKRIHFHYEKPSLHLDAVLKNLVEDGTIRRSLRALCIRVNNIEWISSNLLPRLFSMYPDVEEFSVFFGETNVDIRAEATKESILTSYAILHAFISSKETLVSVDLKLLELPAVQIYQGFTCRFLKPVNEFLKSSHELGKNVYKSPDDIVEFCSRMKNLECITCALNTEPVEGDLQKETFATKFLERVVRECPKLRNLSLNINPSYNIVSLTTELFLAIIESGLECLEFIFEEMKIVGSSTIDDGKKNSTLRSLSLKIDNQDTIIVFLKHFSQLKNLKIFNAEDEVLQAIWKYQSSLTSLQLLNVVPYTWAFTGRGDVNSENYDEKQNTGVSIDRLKNLVYLNIEAIEPDWNATDDIFYHFIFPTLRYLDLEIMDNSGITTTMMEAIEKNVPMAEVIILRYYNEVPYKIWNQLCTRMKHLRYLAVSGDSSIISKYSDHEYKNLFSICPTLHTLVHKHAEGREVFYHNVVQKRVLKKDSNYFYTERNHFDMFTVEKLQI